MTATAAALSREPRFTLIHGGESEGFLAQSRNAASRFWGWITSAPRRFWGWLKDTLHLQPAVDFIRDGARSSMGVLRSIRDAMGASGLTGLGMVTISTESGRKVGGFLMRPVGWAFRMAGQGWTGTKHFMLAHLGTPGTWVGNRMGDVEAVLYGEDGISGVVGAVSSFYTKYVARHLLLDGTMMRIVRLIGTALFAASLINALSLVPWLLGGYLVAAQWILLAGFMASCAYQGYTLGEHVAPMIQKQWNEFTAEEDTVEVKKGKRKTSSIRYSAVPHDHQPARV